jgi:Luciferase-like monooxygenase
VDVPFSVLDLAPIAACTTAAEAFHRSLELAQHAERLGYRRFWLAEHHNMPGIGSSATAIVMRTSPQARRGSNVGPSFST